MKRLIVNADDFGFAHDVNRGIVAAHREGILTATTLMAPGEAFDDAVALARENPALDIGCHLVLVDLPGFPQTLPRLVHAVALGRIPIYDLLARQVDKIVAVGIQPTHLDTHKHTHLLPPVLDAVGRLSEEWGIPWVRRPFDFPAEANGISWSKRALSRSLGLLRRRFHRVLAGHHCRMTDHFAGFRLTGLYDAAELCNLIRQLPDGTTEFMCHPGYLGDELARRRTRLKASRERELRALTSEEARCALKDADVQLTSYRDLMREVPPCQARGPLR